MSITAGTLSQVSVGSTVASLLATAATGGTGPYTYQWYRSTTTGFTPGGGNIIAGATALALNDSGLIPNTVYYYKVVATDTGHSNDTAEYTQLAVTTTPSSLALDQFAQTTITGVVDQAYNYNTKSMQIHSSQSGSLYPGQAVKMYDEAGGVPKVVACSAVADDCIGFINYDFKTQAFVAGTPCQVSQSGNVMWLYSAAAIARGAQVELYVASPATVRTKTGSSGADIVGWALDKASGYGELIRVQLTTPSFTKA